MQLKVIHSPINIDTSFVLNNVANFSDLSGYHTTSVIVDKKIQNRVPRTNLFGNFFKNVSNTALKPYQINGACSFHLESTVESIGESETQDFYSQYNDGQMAINSFRGAGKVLDTNKNYPTMKKFLNEREAVNNRKRYAIFKYNNEPYGISLEAHNNKFADLDKFFSNLKGECLRIGNLEEKKIQIIIVKQKFIIYLEQFFYRRKKFLKNLEPLKEYIDDRTNSIDITQSITVDKNSEPPKEETICEIIAKLYTIEESIKKWPEFDDMKQNIIKDSEEMGSMILFNDDYTKETKLKILEYYRDNLKQKLITPNLDLVDDMNKYYDIVGNNKLLSFIKGNKQIFDINDVEMENNEVLLDSVSHRSDLPNEIHDTRLTSSDKYSIEYDNNNKCILIKTTDSKAFKNIEEIKIIPNSNQEIDDYYINNIKFNIEKKGFSYLIEQKIPTQMKIKGESKYKDIGKHIAKSMDEDLLIQDKTIQFGYKS